MRWGVYISLIVVAAVAASYVAFKLKYPDYSYRYRLQLSIEVDGKIHTGSSVIDVVWQGGPNIEAHGAYGAHGVVRGQAPLIDLGDRGIIVGALFNPLGQYVTSAGVSALFICPRAFGAGSSLSELPQLLKLTGRRDLMPENWPYLVWLSDRSDPKSARRLLPADIDKVATGARFSAAFVEITDDPVVIDVGKRLPWYESWANGFRRQGLVVSRPGETVLAPDMLVGGPS